MPWWTLARPFSSQRDTAGIVCRPCHRLDCIRWLTNNASVADRWNCRWHSAFWCRWRLSWWWTIRWTCHFAVNFTQQKPFWNVCNWIWWHLCCAINMATGAIRGHDVSLLIRVPYIEWGWVGGWGAKWTSHTYRSQHTESINNRIATCWFVQINQVIIIAPQKWVRWHCLSNGMAKSTQFNSSTRVRNCAWLGKHAQRKHTTKGLEWYVNKAAVITEREKKFFVPSNRQDAVNNGIFGTVIESNCGPTDKSCRKSNERCSWNGQARAKQNIASELVKVLNVVITRKMSKSQQSWTTLSSFTHCYNIRK